MSSFRWTVSWLGALLAALSLAAGADAAVGHRKHTTRISGVVVSLNVKHHTLRLRVGHAPRGHRAAARAHAAAAGGATIVLSFAQASVTGGGGAVAVGDEITVTTDGTVGQTAVASSIAVIGEPNGGQGGRGAAVAGDVTAVDVAADTLTLAVRGGGQPQSVTVQLDPATILAVGDTNSDGQITIADIATGDHVVVFTPDASADPIAAVGILDATHAGANAHEGDSAQGGSSGGDGSESSDATYEGFNGTVVSVSATELKVQVGGDGPLAGQVVLVDVTPTTRYRGVSGLGAVQPGDAIRVYATSLDPQPIVAVFIGDGSGGEDGSSTPSGDAPPAPAPTTSGPTRFGGVVPAVRGDGLTVQVPSGGPLSGTTVIVAVPPSASITGVPSLANVAIGDDVEIFTANQSAAVVVATAVVDDSAPPPAS